jgi:cytoskeleton protein RodZ
MLKSEATYEKIGAKFADKRKELGMSISNVSAALKIRPTYLKAIEQGKLDKIPSGIFVQGYIKSYAKFLNISPQLESSNNSSSYRIDNLYCSADPKIAKQIPNLKVISLSILAIVLINLFYYMWNLQGI